MMKKSLHIYGIDNNNINDNDYMKYNDDNNRT